MASRYSTADWCIELGRAAVSNLLAPGVRAMFLFTIARARSGRTSAWLTSNVATATGCLPEPGLMAFPHGGLPGDTLARPARAMHGLRLCSIQIPSARPTVTQQRPNIGHSGAKHCGCISGSKDL